MTGAPFPRHSHLRLVPPEPQSRHRLAVRISVLDGHSAFGRSRVFRLPHNDLDELIAVAMWTVEAEALPVPVLLRLLREKIESFMPENALRVAKAAENSEIQQLRIFARAFEEGGRAPR